MFWGWMKQETRKRCEHDFHRFQAQIPLVIEDASIASVRRHARRCLRTMDAYRRDGLLVGPMMDYCMKKYTSHRRLPPEFAIQSFLQDYERHVAQAKAQKK